MHPCMMPKPLQLAPFNSKVKALLLTWIVNPAPSLRAALFLQPVSITQSRLGNGRNLPETKCSFFTTTCTVSVTLLSQI